MEKHLRLAEFGTAFATRSKGAQMAENVSDIIKSLPKLDKLVIDFRGVQALSFSFADELLLRLWRGLEDEEAQREIVVCASRPILDVLNETIRRRNYRVIRMVVTDSGNERGAESALTFPTV